MAKALQQPGPSRDNLTPVIHIPPDHRQALGRLELALHLTNPSPLVVMDRQPAGLDPLRLHLDGAATPLAGQIDLDVEVLPWSAEARVDVDLDVRGLDGRALPDVFPLLIFGSLPPINLRMLA